jgi:hypothetical protein
MEKRGIMVYRQNGSGIWLITMQSLKEDLEIPNEKGQEIHVFQTTKARQSGL